MAGVCVWGGGGSCTPSPGLVDGGWAPLSRPRRDDATEARPAVTRCSSKANTALSLVARCDSLGGSTLLARWRGHPHAHAWHWGLCWDTPPHTPPGAALRQGWNRALPAWPRKRQGRVSHAGHKEPRAPVAQGLAGGEPLPPSRAQREPGRVPRWGRGGERRCADLGEREAVLAKPSLLLVPLM